MARRIKLNQSNYYSEKANMQYFSISQYKDFMKCEAMALAKITGAYKPEMTRAMLIGSFVDTYFEGTQEQFIKENPAVFTRKNELRSEFRKANQIISRIENDELFMKFMSGEKQRIMTFEMFGVPWKMKMDSYLPGICITDLKIVAKFRALPFWRYDLQGAGYQKGVEIVTGERLPFYLAVATKERTIDLDVFQIPQSTLDAALYEIERNIGHYAEVKAGLVPPTYCGECDYCKSIKAARIRNYNELLEV
ncbi:PD-(D/E)XK nuclease-like domain-containing protein [Blautia obeum]|uniref:PD-(D/E)XK nuclease-like domain-containing protein n=1 Tax=Blautia obeum TaxID=40520 RepID=UPI003035759F|nr:PD-(D/E)XK nuclease-like domain-containing protein [Lachnospiraceae bacterium]